MWLFCAWTIGRLDTPLAFLAHAAGSSGAVLHLAIGDKARGCKWVKFFQETVCLLGYCNPYKKKLKKSVVAIVLHNNLSLSLTHTSRPFESPKVLQRLKLGVASGEEISAGLQRDNDREVAVAGS